MMKLSQKQQKILLLLLQKTEISSSEIQEEIAKSNEKSSLVTIKRLLTEMVGLGVINIAGAGRSTVYSISAKGRIFTEIDAKNYCSIEPDKRYGQKKFNFALIPAFSNFDFSPREEKELLESTGLYLENTDDISDSIQKKELERLVIELSWKSSKIEGNTYTLLDTEKLLLNHKEAPGKSKAETQMILNHKDAFDYIYLNSKIFKTITEKNLQELHKLLVKGLGIKSGWRNKPVGILGSIYHPLDNIHQIEETIKSLFSLVSKIKSPYVKAFLAFVGISYIQPFEDGNKRCSRLMANALLMAHGLAPLSYRSIEEEEYREALLAFYELNTLMPIKKIFVEQYYFAAKNYFFK